MLVLFTSFSGPARIAARGSPKAGPETPPRRPAERPLFGPTAVCLLTMFGVKHDVFVLTTYDVLGPTAVLRTYVFVLTIPSTQARARELPAPLPIRALCLTPLVSNGLVCFLQHYLSNTAN